MGIRFLPAPVEIVLGELFRPIIGSQERLIIDLTDSYTNDGIVFGGGGGYEWEWDWGCVVPKGRGGEGGGECVFEGGEVVQMPGRGQGRFEGGGVGGGEEWVVGRALYFIVRVKVREGGGGRVVARGEWEAVVSVVRGGVFNGPDQGGFLRRNLKVNEERWMCRDSSSGFSVF